MTTTEAARTHDEEHALRMRPAVVYRPESALFWVFIVSLIIGTGVTASLLGAAFVESVRAEFWLSPLWFAAIAALVWLIFKFDPFRSTRPYKQALFAGTALGGTLAMALTLGTGLSVESILAYYLPPDTLAAWSSGLRAPVVEETAKAMCVAVILLLCASVFHRISHALIVGMFVGLGFDIIEDLNYAGHAAIASLDGDAVGAWNTLLERWLASLPSHWSYTGIAAVGVLLLLPTFSGAAQWTRLRRVGVAVALFVIAWFMHFWFDAPPLAANALGVAIFLLKYPACLAIFLVTAILLIRDERHWVIDRIARGRESGTLTDVDQAVLDSLPTLKARRQLRKAAKRSGGKRAAKAVAVQQAQALDLIQATG